MNSDTIDIETRPKSRQLFADARRVLPGGVNSPVRAFRGVGGSPVYIKEGSGAFVIDEDGTRYIDFLGSWGPLIAGHAHPDVVEAVQEALIRGFSFGAPTAVETKLAEMIIERVPPVEMVRLVNSGTEATMSAVRLARAFTGRDRILKFDGCYHGHADCFLIGAGSGTLDIGEPDSPGVPSSVARDTLVARFNDADSVAGFFQEYIDEIACVIVEPVGGNAGCIPPEGSFLSDLKRLCDENGALLIFDEVMTGFRIARGGAVERFGIEPDLVTFGKVMGGGFPIGAYGGSRRIMEQIAPSGAVYQAGTLSGNPVAVAAGIATLNLLDDAAYDTLEHYGHLMESCLNLVIQTNDFPVTVQRVGSMFSIFFKESPVHSVADTDDLDTAGFRSFFHGMLDDGIYLAPSPFECSFLSLAHSEITINTFIEKAEKHLKRVYSG